MDNVKLIGEFENNLPFPWVRKLGYDKLDSGDCPAGDTPDIRFKELGRYINSDELKKDTSINSLFIEELNQYTFKQASHISYFDLEKKEEIDSWEFKFENIKAQSIVITTNPPINNPIYLAEDSKPQQIEIGPNKILLTQNGKYISMLLKSNIFNNITSGRKENNVMVWIDGNNISKDDAIAISKVFVTEFNS